MFYHLVDWWDSCHMLNLFPFKPFWMIVVWLIFAVIAYLVYKDAEKRGMNGLLWGLPVLIPWIGIIFLILYLILREEKLRAASRTTPEEILDEICEGRADQRAVCADER